MRKRYLLRLVVGAALFVLLTLSTSRPALADNCGSLSDCFGTTGAAIAALVAAAILVGILAVALPALLAAAAEAAAEAAAVAAEEAAAEEAAAVATEEAAAEAEAAEAAEAAESNFASEEKLVGHYEKHVLEGGEFGDISQEEYLQGARDLTRGGDGIEQFTRPTTGDTMYGDTMYYKPSTNEFGVKSADGIIRTYFKPDEVIGYWMDQLAKYGGGTP